MRISIKRRVFTQKWNENNLNNSVIMIIVLKKFFKFNLMKTLGGWRRAWAVRSREMATARHKMAVDDDDEHGWFLFQQRIRIGWGVSHSERGTHINLFKVCRRAWWFVAFNLTMAETFPFWNARLWLYGSAMSRFYYKQFSIYHNEREQWVILSISINCTMRRTADRCGRDNR